MWGKRIKLYDKGKLDLEKEQKRLLITAERARNGEKYKGKIKRLLSSANEREGQRFSKTEIWKRGDA